MPGSLIDMHMHTVRGAYDSGLKPAHLAEDARKVGLTGVNITEHDRLWDGHALGEFRASEAPLFVNNGVEVSTDMGHVIAIGLPRITPGLHRIEELRRAADEVGGYLIVAHPFRHWFEPVHFMRQGKTPVEMVPELLAKQAVFDYVDAVEVLNGCCTPRENLIALAVANHLGKPGSGGSDCHSRQGIGCCCTVFEKPLETPEDLLRELHAGRFQPAHDLHKGRLTLLTATSMSA